MNEVREETGWRPWLLRKLEFFSEPVLAMAALFVVILLGLAFLGMIGAPKESLRMEWAKALLDAGVVGIAGAFIAYVVEKHGRNIERQQQQQDEAAAERARDIEALRLRLSSRQESLKATLNRVTSSYNNSKRARRDMRALALDRSGEAVRVDLDRYDKYMAELNEAQLELETIISDVKSDKETYASAFRLRTKLGQMENYLGEIIGEYEKARSRAGRVATDIPLAPLTMLSDFLDEETGPRFKKEFKGGHREAIEAIHKDLLKLTSAKNALKSP